MVNSCKKCGWAFPPHLDRCENCHNDLGAPNVRAATQRSELRALGRRLRDALDDAKGRGCLPVLERFRHSVAQSRAVICKSLGAVHGMAAEAEGSWLMSTYHAQVAAGIRAPDKPEWASARLHESRWFPNYAQHIQYGALSLGESGVSGWGEVSLVLNEVAISERASVGEENAVLFARRLAFEKPIPEGFRARWRRRDKLCVAKLAGKLTAGTDDSEFPAILMSSAHDREKADFVEVHIYGKLLLEGVACVRVSRKFEQDVMHLWKKLRSRGILVEFFEEETESA